MAFTQADVDALDVAYKTGARQIRSSDGRLLELHSVADYIRLRSLMLNDAAPTGTGVRFVKTYTDSGF